MILKNFLKDRKDINLIYMAETLVMGDAFNRFINPERIIIGVEKKIRFLNEFKKFKCKIFQYNLKQAEMVKMAINLFLFNSVSYANLMDNYCRQFGFKFSDINESIRSDKRIGKKILHFSLAWYKWRSLRERYIYSHKDY